MRIRLDAACASTQTTAQETASHGKVVQREFSLHLLVAELLNQPGAALARRFLHLHGCVPTNLMVVDRTTAECTKAVMLAQHQRVSELDAVASNLKAEKSMLADRFSEATKYTKTCDVHIAAQVQSQAGNIVSDEISGLLNTALSQQGSGTLLELRGILADILEQELEIVYDQAPAGHELEYRAGVYDLYLPYPQPSRQVVLRRHVLGHLFNGSLEQKPIQHFCAFNCCSSYEHTVSKMKKYGAWALMPNKCPRLIRAKWTNQEQAVSWAGLLDAHHGLLRRVMVRFGNLRQRVQRAVPEPEPLD